MRTKQHVSLRLGIAVGALAFGLVACSEEPTSPENSLNSPGPISGSIGRPVETRSDDPGLHMIRELRAQPDSLLESRLERSGGLAIIGIREPAAERGFGRSGENLVSSGMKRDATDLLRGHAEIEYEFEDMPAVLVRFRNPQALRSIRNLPWVDYVATSSGEVTPDVLNSCASGGSALTSPQVVGWQIGRTRASQAWSLATGDLGTSRRLIILDDGTDYSDPELIHAEVGYAPPRPVGEGNHGTLTMGAATARNNGVGVVGIAPDAYPVGARIQGLNLTDWEMFAPVAIAEQDNFAEVMSLSYSRKNWTSSNPPGEFAPLYNAILAAQSQYDVVFVASTGNQNHSDWYSFPATYSEVIGVGGVDQSDDWDLGPSGDPQAVGGIGAANYAPGNVDLVAPARDVALTCPGTRVGISTGTSFATPMVAAAAMIIREILPNANEVLVRNLIVNNAEYISGDANRFGAGMLDVYAAAAAAQAMVLPPLTAYISGPQVIERKGSKNYTAVASGGSGGLGYQWRKRNVGSGSWTNLGTAVTQSVYFPLGGSDIELQVIVTRGSETVYPTITVQNCTTGGCEWEY